MALLPFSVGHSHRACQKSVRKDIPYVDGRNVKVTMADLNLHDDHVSVVASVPLWLSTLS